MYRNEMYQKRMLVTVVLVIRIYTLVQMRLYTLHLGGTVYHVIFQQLRQDLYRYVAFAQIANLISFGGPAPIAATVFLQCCNDNH